MTDKVPAAFGIKSPSEMLDKLQRELSRMRAAEENREHLVDHAINFALTAWHLIDWVWRRVEKDEAAKERVAILLGKRDDGVQLVDLQEYFRNQVNGSLAYCEAIAVSAKHFTASNPKVVTIEARASAAARFTPSKRPIAPHLTIPTQPRPHWVLKINDGDKTVYADQVFEDVYAYWKDFLKDHCF